MTNKQMTQAEADKAWAEHLAKDKMAGGKDLGRRAPDKDWDVDNYVAGTIVNMETTTIDDKPRRFMEVHTADGDVSVWDNIMLKRLFDNAKVGDAVAIMYTHTEKLDGGRTLRHFRVSLQPGAGK